MKKLLIIIVSILTFTATKANNIEKLSVGTTGKSTITLNYTSTTTDKATIEIVNANGAVVKTIAVDAINGTNAANLVDVNTLAEGTYTIKLTVGNETSTTKFVHFGSLDNML
jgi:flagellar hook assembly protein FlgD